jgi:hypothetical protein
MCSAFSQDCCIDMIPKTQALKIARLLVALALSAGLLYFLYSKNSPRPVSWLITLAILFFMTLMRRSGVFDKSPGFRRLALASSRKPLRDFFMAVVCFAVTMVIVIAISIGVREKVLPDNYVTGGFLLVVIVGGLLGVLFFISGVIGRLMYGPPPPP